MTKQTSLTQRAQQQKNYVYLILHCSQAITSFFFFFIFGERNAVPASVYQEHYRYFLRLYTRGLCIIVQRTRVS